jgi:hypothetical protein
MQLDEMKAAWAAHGVLLERSLAIDERLLRELLMRKVRFALAPHVLWRALEVALGIAALCLVVLVLRAHPADPRYLVVAGTLAVFTVGITALCARGLVSALRLDLAGPVTAIQRDIQRIKLLEFRALKWALLGGILFWLPASLVFFEALSGVEGLARIELPYLLANVLLGSVVLVAGLLLSRRFVERVTPAPWALRMVDAISGRGLRAATVHLAELARFEREEPPAAP